MGTTHFSGLNIKMTALNEGAAGDFDVPDIAVGDVILAVVAVHIDLGEAAPPTMTMTAANLTSEFSITGAATINNTDGTSLADCVAFCLWVDVDA